MPQALYSDTLPSRTITIAGREYLYCSGTGYLGLHADTDFQALIAEGLARYGGHFGGSRLSQIQVGVYEAAEERIAAWAGAEAALVLSSGTLAGQLVVRHLAQGHLCCFAPGVHPALWGVAQVDHGSFDAWAEQICGAATRSQGPQAFFANALDPLLVRRFDFSWIRALPDDLPVVLVLDDSHGIGLTGPDGGGVYSQIECPPNVALVVISSLSKAPGIPAGVILGPRKIIESIRQNPLFGGASPPTPAFLHALIHGEAIYRRNRERLMARVRQFVAGLPTQWSFRYLPGFPVFHTPHDELASVLEAQGILISSFAYPTPTDERITRVVLNALHKEEDVSTLIHACNGL